MCRLMMRCAPCRWPICCGGRDVRLAVKLGVVALLIVAAWGFVVSVAVAAVVGADLVLGLHLVAPSSGAELETVAAASVGALVMGSMMTRLVTFYAALCRHGPADAHQGALDGE